MHAHTHSTRKLADTIRASKDEPANPVARKVEHGDVAVERRCYCELVRPAGPGSGEFVHLSEPPRGDVDIDGSAE